MPVVDTISLRQGNEATWLAVDPVLAQGEPGYVTDTNELVFGDGTSAFSTLPRIGASTGGLTTLDLGITPENAARGFDGWRWTRVLKQLIWRGASGSWDAASVEWPNVTRYREKLYMAYHGKGPDHNAGRYQVGMATLDPVAEGSPFGEWTKHDGPILTEGASGEWDGPGVGFQGIAHPTIIHLPDTNAFAVTYWTLGKMGVAFFDDINDPTATMTKHPTPILDLPGGGWGSPVWHHDGRFHAIVPGTQGADFPYDWQVWRSTVESAGAAGLTAPWEKHTDMQFDISGVGESMYIEVRSIHRIGTEFYCFGTLREMDHDEGATYGTRTQHIAVFASSDLATWRPIPDTPLIFATTIENLGTGYTRRRPDDYAYEHPFPLTLPGGQLAVFANSRGTRQQSAWVGTPPGRAVDVFVPRHAEITALAASASTDDGDTSPIDLHGIERLTVTILPTFGEGATEGIEVEFYDSTDGVNYDTEPTETLTVAETVTRKTWVIDVPGRAYGQLRVKNLDAAVAVTSVRLDYRVTAA